MPEGGIDPKGAHREDAYAFSYLAAPRSAYQCLFREDAYSRFFLPAFFERIFQKKIIIEENRILLGSYFNFCPLISNM